MNLNPVDNKKYVFGTKSIKLIKKEKKRILLVKTFFI